MINNIPYTPYSTPRDFGEPWLMDENNPGVITIDGLKMTATNIWNTTVEEREKLLKKVFDVYRSVVGFPYDIDIKSDFKKDIDKLKNTDSSSVLIGENIISNSSRCCLNVCRHYNSMQFWSARGDKRSLSVVDVFNDDELFINVLKNRMGWRFSKEDGIPRPYVFSISDKMIIQGIKSSGLGYGVSNFRPAIAKFLVERYDAKKVLDYSAGWGARMLGTMCASGDDSLYIGIDPLTHNNINNMIYDFEFQGRSVCICGGSEDVFTYKKIDEIMGIDKFDLVMSCPPYFTLERYASDISQSYNQYNEYGKWLEGYWRSTVRNCVERLDDNGRFILIIKDAYGKFNLKDDMSNIVKDAKMCLDEVFQYNTTSSHLSSKAKTGKTNKKSEYILVFKKQ